jgi:hypothetical protein
MRHSFLSGEEASSRALGRNSVPSLRNEGREERSASKMCYNDDMRSWLRKGCLFLLLICCWSAAALPGCGKAAAPGPIAEVPMPAVLKFVNYEGLRIDLGAISPPGAQAQIVAGKDIPIIDFTAGDMIAQYVRYGPNAFSYFAGTFLAPTLTGIEKIGIPTEDAQGQPTTVYQAEVAFTTGPDCATAGGVLSCTHEITVDFRQFDFNGNGDAADDCSGNAKHAPVCIRLWLGPAPFIAGVIEAPATYAEGATVPSAIGKGHFKVNVASYAGYSSAIAYTYDDTQTAQSLKAVEYWFSTRPEAGITTGENNLNIQEWTSHSIVGQQGEPATALKTITMNDLVTQQEAGAGNPVGQGDFQYLGQYREGGNYWSGSLQSVNGISGGTITPDDNKFEFGGIMQNVCAYIGPDIPDDMLYFGTVAYHPLDDCQGISVGTTPFISAFDPLAVAFPFAAFPATPPTAM